MSMDTNSVDQLKALLGRLGSGEDLASVRDDFVKEFKSVPVKDIMEAEQELIKEGTDPKTVTKLCDRNCSEPLLTAGRSQRSQQKQLSKLHKR